MKFNYIISAYFGNRRTTLNYKERLLDIHLDFFNENTIEELNKIIVILNVDKNNDIEKLQIIKEKYQNLPIDYIIKDNIGGSYYNYELGLLNSIFLDSNVEYCFTIEDDYMPFDANFYIPFVNKLKDENTVFVCQAMNGTYAGITNGMFDMKKIKNFYLKYNKILNVDLQTDYNTLDKNQREFTDFLLSEYKITDISDYCHPSYSISSMIYYMGNIKGDILIKPIVSEYIFIKKLKSDYYSINYDNVDIGCFTFLNGIIKYSIKKEYKNLSYKVQREITNYIFNRYDIVKLSLQEDIIKEDFFSTNAKFDIYIDQNQIHISSEDKIETYVKINTLDNSGLYAAQISFGDVKKWWFDIESIFNYDSIKVIITDIYHVIIYEKEIKTK